MTLLEEVGLRDDLLLPFDCPRCTDGEFSGDREVVEMRRWEGGDPNFNEGEWIHFFACADCEHDLTSELAVANGTAVKAEEHRRGRR